MVKAGQHIQRMIRPGLVPGFFFCFFNLGKVLTIEIIMYIMIAKKHTKRKGE
jgi:hypothetical protein